MAFVDRGRYKIGRGTELAVTGRDEIRGLLDPHVQRAAEQVAVVCGAASSWGFYAAYHGRQQSIVAVLSAAGGDSDRGRRLLAAMGRAGDVL